MKLSLFEKCLHSKNTPNIILYGNPFIYNEMIETIYKIRNIKYIKDGNYHSFQYKYSDYHYEINCEELKKDNLNDFFTIFDMIIKYKEFYSDVDQKIIILYNADTLKLSIQNKLRVIIEKYRENCIFIFFCNKLNSLIEPLKSRCITIRRKNLSIYNRCEIIHTLKDQKDKNKLYDQLQIFDTKEDVFFLNNSKEELKDFTDIYQITVDKIYIYLKQNLTINNFSRLKNEAYLIIKYNLKIEMFLKIFLSTVLSDDKLIDTDKYNIIRKFAEIEHKLLKSYKKVILLEGLLIYLQKIIYNRY